MDKKEWVFEATLDNFQTQVLERSTQVPVVIDVWAAWCAPCKQLMPVLEKLAAEYGGRFLLAKVNADEQQALVARLGVRSLPTVFLLHGGRLVDHFGGAQPESAVRKWLDRHVEAPPADPLVVAADLEAQGLIDEAAEVLSDEFARTPQNHEVAVQLAALRLKLGHYEDAGRILAALPEDRKRVPLARQVKAGLDYAAKAPDLPDIESLLRRLEMDPDKPQTLVQLGQKKLLMGREEEGIGHLFDLFVRFPGETRWRQALLEAFEFLGAEHPITRTYRRRLYASLH